MPIANKELEDPIYTCGVINNVASRLKVDPNPFLVDGFYADRCMRNFSAVATMCSQGGIYLNKTDIFTPAIPLPKDEDVNHLTPSFTLKDIDSQTARILLISIAEKCDFVIPEKLIDVNSPNQINARWKAH